jgi:hypothetical protein
MVDCDKWTGNQLLKTGLVDKHVTNGKEKWRKLHPQSDRRSNDGLRTRVKRYTLLKVATKTLFNKI